MVGILRNRWRSLAEHVGHDSSGMVPTKTGHRERVGSSSRFAKSDGLKGAPPQNARAHTHVLFHEILARSCTFLAGSMGRGGQTIRSQGPRMHTRVHIRTPPVLVLPASNQPQLDKQSV